METLKHPACTVGWVVRLSQLAFPGASNPNFPWEKSHWGNTVEKKNSSTVKICLHDHLWDWLKDGGIMGWLPDWVSHNTEGKI